MAKKQVKVPIVQGRLGAKTVSLSNGAKKKKRQVPKTVEKDLIYTCIYLLDFIFLSSSLWHS